MADSTLSFFGYTKLQYTKYIACEEYENFANLNKISRFYLYLSDYYFCYFSKYVCLVPEIKSRRHCLFWARFPIQIATLLSQSFFIFYFLFCIFFCQLNVRVYMISLTSSRNKTFFFFFFTTSWSWILLYKVVPKHQRLHWPGVSWPLSSPPIFCFLHAVDIIA